MNQSEHSPCSGEAGLQKLSVPSCGPERAVPGGGAGTEREEPAAERRERRAQLPSPRRPGGAAVATGTAGEGDQGAPGGGCQGELPVASSD